MPDQDHIRARLGKPEDAGVIAKILIASITDLCAADHKDDPKIVRAWTANKTPQNILHWMANPRCRILVAGRGEQIMGVAGYLTGGHINLNYVAPAFQYQGVSDLMLSRVKRDLSVAGVTTAHLSSTLTVERFYLARGRRPEGPLEYAFGMPGQPMVKVLTGT